MAAMATVKNALAAGGRRSRQAVILLILAPFLIPTGCLSPGRCGSESRGATTGGAEVRVEHRHGSVERPGLLTKVVRMVFSVLPRVTVEFPAAAPREAPCMRHVTTTASAAN